jgi:hypothetical protein
MTMTLGKPYAALLTAGLLVGLTSGAWAQNKPAKKAAKKKPTPAAATAPAPAPAPAPDANANPAGQPDDSKIDVQGKRDPFVALVNQDKGGAVVHLPPGKAGLMIAQVRVDGAIHGPNGMIAVVSNPANSVYFVREGDRLYDGDVEKIGMDGVTFRENSKDAFGKPVERMVTKRIYASAGEQQ